MPEAVVKTCILCGRDCASRPRVRDQHGRYRCRECLDKRPPAPPATAPPPKPAPDDPIPLADDDGLVPLAPEAPAPPRRSEPCGGCGRPLFPDNVICIGCGFNRATGRMVDSPVTAADPRARARHVRKCSNCDYELTGLPSGKCPECGTINRDPKFDKRERELRESRRIAKRAWISPIIMIAVGLGIMFIVHAARNGLPGIVFFSVTFGIHLAVGLFIYLACSIMWIGFDEPLPMTGLRLAGVFALAEVAYSLVSIVTMAAIGLFGITLLIIPLLIYAGLLAKVMEIEIQDAVIVAVLTTIARIITIAFLITWLAGLI